MIEGKSELTKEGISRVGRLEKTTENIIMP